MNMTRTLRHCCVALLATFGLAAAQAQASPLPLQITVFIHQDVKIPTSQIYRDYLQHWEQSMNDITGRKVNFHYISPGSGHPATTLEYQNEELEIPLAELTRLAYQHFDQYPTEGPGHLEKALLVTQGALSSTAGGSALHEGKVAIASLLSYANAGHELGHLFGATHDLSEGGWASMCDSYMSPARNPFKTHCYAFSEANQGLLRETLNKSR